MSKEVFFVMHIKKIILLLTITMILAMAACSNKAISDEKVKDVDYTVVAEADIPDTLRNAIEEKKEEPFKLSYSDGESLYIAVGYGRQSSGGYSIVVDELYMTDSNIVYATTLTGPDNNSVITDKPSFPYMVVKTEYTDCEVIYE